MARKRATFVVGMSCCCARYGSSFILTSIRRPLSTFAARTRGTTCLPGTVVNARNFSADRRRERRKQAPSTTNEQKGPHPRNSFKGSYDMEKLCGAYPPLKSFIISPDRSATAKSKKSNKAPSRPTIKFADPNAVRALNTALLVADYGIAPNYSDILPTEALIPPVPGRADYIHFVADLLGAESGRIPEGPSVRGLDIGTGASVIYPLIATSAYGWSMIASEINPISVQSAGRIIQSNELENLIDLRRQESQKNIFDGIWEPNEEIDFIMCNPPFFPSLEAFQTENARKVKGLARGGMNKRKSRNDSKEAMEEKKSEVQSSSSSSNNFGGTDSELWCKGGEVSFVRRMIDESKSKRYRRKFLWCTSLVSRAANAEQIEKYLRKTAQPKDTRRISFGAGKKSASILAWTFLDKYERKEWAEKWR